MSADAAEYSGAVASSSRTGASRGEARIGGKRGNSRRLGRLLLQPVVDGNVLGHELHAGSRRGLVDEDREVALRVAGLHELVDLSLIGKQLHWSVVGPLFRPLHLQLDELVDSWRELSDSVAERAVALGFVPDGQARAVVVG